MEKKCNFDTNSSDFNSVDLKKTQKIIKGQKKFHRPNAKIFKFYDFFQRFGLVCRQLFRKSISVREKAIKVAKRP